MDPESIRRKAKFKIIAWCTLGALCAVLAAPYALTDKILTFLDKILNKLMDNAEHASWLSRIPDYTVVAGLVLLYCITAPLFFVTLFPGYFFSEGAREIFLGSEWDKDIDLPLIDRALFELDTGVKYKSVAQAEKVRGEQQLESKEPYSGKKISAVSRKEFGAGQSVENTKERYAARLAGSSGIEVSEGDAKYAAKEQQGQHKKYGADVLMRGK
jgi:hypothetical protein